MPMHVGEVQIKEDYCLYYRKKLKTIIVCAADKEEAKELFLWLAQQVELLSE